MAVAHLKRLATQITPFISIEVERVQKLAGVVAAIMQPFKARHSIRVAGYRLDDPETVRSWRATSR
jgi:hypothetical protein